MFYKAAWAAALACAAIPGVAYSKEPAAEDEAAIRRIVTRIYQSYTLPVTNPNVGGSREAAYLPGAAMGGYRPALTPRLDDLLKRWWPAMQRAEQIYSMNGFDWYCQCQDSDNATARLVSQRYWSVSRNRIDAIVHFSPGAFDGQDSGAPLVLRFRRQKSVWKLDDLKFSDSSTLRDGLSNDIRDARKDLAAEKPE
jgi:hypothetical protein